MNNELILTDAQGTPAGYGDTVQYILDKLGETGPELLSSDDADWSLSGSASISSGEITINAGGSGEVASQSTACEQGKTYILSFDIESISGSVALRVGHNSVVYYSAPGKQLKAISINENSSAANTFSSVAIYVDGATTAVIKNISVRELKGSHALQTNSSLKAVRGRVPVGGRRNLLPSTNLDGWGTNSISVSGYQDPKYPSAITLTDTADSGDTWHFVFARVFPTDGSAFCGRFLAKAGTLSKIGFRTRYISDSNEIAVIDLMTGNLSGSVAVMGEVIFETSLLANGWVEIKFTAASGQSDSRYDAFGLVLVSDSADGTYSSNLYIGDGNGTVHIAQPQGELGVEHAEFQRVTSNLDIYEPGAQHTEYLRFDHVDDKMAQTFPDGFTGDLVVCGTEGSWVDKDVTVAAGNDLVIGPKNLPNTSHILPALGDIIGWVPVGKSLTSAEQRAIVDYYKGRGAKGRLVPSGVELVTNGTFDSDLSGWYGSSEWQSLSGEASINSALLYKELGQTIESIAGRPYLLTFDLRVVSGQIRFALNATNYATKTFSAGVHSAAIIFIRPNDSRTKRFAFRNQLETEAYIDNISIQELIPEEELA